MPLRTIRLNIVITGSIFVGSFRDSCIFVNNLLDTLSPSLSTPTYISAS